MGKSDLVSLPEIAERAGVARITAYKWRERHQNFPAPYVTLAIGPIWDWRKVERWLWDTGRAS